MRQPEAKFKTALNEGFDHVCVFPNGWRAYIKALAKNGVPDLHYQVPGGAGVWAEVKVGKNPLSKVQLLTCGRMVAAGAMVKVLTLVNPMAPKSVRVVGIHKVVRQPKGVYAVILQAEMNVDSIKTPQFWNMVFA